MAPVLFRTVTCLALLAPLGLAAQSALPKQSPFAPPAGSVAAPVANETLEFAGVSSMGKKIDVIIHDKEAKRKHWIAVGDTVEGISVLRYDAGREQAVIRVNDTEKVLPLRKAAGTAAAPAGVPAVHTGFSIPPPAPVHIMPQPAPQPATVSAAPMPNQSATPAGAPTTPATPEAQAKAETEARMLVSDLLEIGMAQRKAYEEAQRKAAGGSDPQAPVPPPQLPPAAGEAVPPPAEPAGPPPSQP